MKRIKIFKILRNARTIEELESEVNKFIQDKKAVNMNYLLNDNGVIIIIVEYEEE